MTKFAYASHDIVQGKPKIEGLPSTFAADDEVETLIVTLKDETAQLSVDLRYSIFPKVNTITRSFTITNHGTHEATIERAASFSTDMEEKDWAMVYLAGDWTREGVQHRRKIEHGTQG
jgi:alpha-galactosidase